MELKDITKEAVIVTLDNTLEDAVRKMITGNANALIAVDENGEFAGEVNVSDLFEAVVPEHLDGDMVLEHFSSEQNFIDAFKDAADKPVSEFVTRDTEPVMVTDSLLEVAASAIAHQHSRIPVVDHDNHPIGVISRSGLKRVMAKFLGIEENK